MHHPCPGHPGGGRPGQATRRYNFVQPDRFEVHNADFTWNGTVARNIVCDDFSSLLTITLETDIGKVPRGSSIRIFNFDPEGTDIEVKVGSSVLCTLDQTNRYGEFLFYIDESDDPHWVCIVNNQSALRLP